MDLLSLLFEEVLPVVSLCKTSTPRSTEVVLMFGVYRYEGDRGF